jgi:hypothetical protein
MKVHRRDFVKSAALASGTALTSTRSTLGGVLGANDRINIGVIGVAGAGAGP